jgi:hypothetical protein
VKTLFAYFDSLGKIVGSLTALVVLISGAVTLYFKLRPPSPVKGKAAFTSQELKQFGPPTPLQSYLKLAGETSLAHGYSTRALNTIGVYYTVPVSLSGLGNTDTKLVWSLYRSTDRAPVADWINQPAGTLKALRNDFACVVKVWIQLPPLPGSYFAVIEIDLGGEALDSIETPTFTGLAPLALLLVLPQLRLRPVQPGQSLPAPRRQQQSRRFQQLQRRPPRGQARQQRRQRPARQ